MMSASFRLAGEPARPLPPSLRVLVGAAVLSMFLVLLMGALVTNSGSAEGCGDSWPLCDGAFLPSGDIHSIIEYSHRAVSGIAGILVFAMVIGVMRRYGKRPEIRILMPAALFFIVLQAILGAMAVMWPQPDTVLALHFGISLAAFAAVLLPAVLLAQMEKGTTHRERPVSDRLRRFVWGATAYIYAVVYTGAYVRHTNSHLACLDWPLCGGEIIPPLSGEVGIQFFHRAAAAGAALVLAWLVYLAARERARRPDVFRGAVSALALVLLQVASGAYVVLSHLTLTSMMIHSAVITLLFGALGYLCLQVATEPRMRQDSGRMMRAMGES